MTSATISDKSTPSNVDVDTVSYIIAVVKTWLHLVIVISLLVVVWIIMMVMVSQ